jgi:hypothetical protein
MTRNHRWAVLAAVGLLGSQCGLFTPAGNPRGSGRATTQLLGAAGGTITLDDVTLEIPVGALPRATQLTVTSRQEPAIGLFDAFSPVYVFGPEGTKFDVPITVRLTATQPGGSRLVVFWTKPGSLSEYEELPSVQGPGGVVTARVRHFSQGFLGESKKEPTDAAVAGEVPDAGNPAVDSGTDAGDAGRDGGEDGGEDGGDGGGVGGPDSGPGDAGPRRDAGP